MIIKFQNNGKENVMKKIIMSIIFLTILSIYTLNGCATNRTRIEPLIKQREWGKVSQIVNPGRDAKLYHQVYMIRKFLDSYDSCNKFPDLDCYKQTMIRWKPLTNQPLKFSKEFVFYLNTQKDNVLAKVKQIKEEKQRRKKKKDNIEVKIQQSKEEKQQAFSRAYDRCEELEDTSPESLSSLRKVLNCYHEAWDDHKDALQDIFFYNRKGYDANLAKKGRAAKEKIKGYSDLSKKIKKLERDEQIAQRKKEQIRKEQERLRKQEEARIKKEEEKKEKKHQEEKALQVVSSKAAKLGYKKVLPYGIARFLYRVKHGKNNLEEALKAILWCKPGSHDAKLDRLFEVFQILEYDVIYHLSEFDKDKLIEFTIIMPKEQKRLYMEGQKLSGEYFTYVGPFTYTTVLGAKRTIQIFRHVDLDWVPPWLK